jgi:poly(A) polymerase
MTPVGVLKDTPWKVHHALGQFIHQLSQKNITVRLVGGAIREALLNRFDPSCDLDLAVDATPGEIIAICLGLGVQVIPSGLIYGTVTCIIDNKSYEITSLRQDISTDGRKAVVRYTKNWKEDANRRDLTINALYADWDGTYYDPTGMGYEDLNNNYLRFIGDPLARIKEDFLRIVRFFRFMGLFKKPNCDKQAYDECIRMAKHLKTVSLERKWNELQKTFKSYYPINAIESLISSNIMSEVCRINWSLNKLERSLPWVQNYLHDIFYGIVGGVNQFTMDRNICIPISLQKRLEDVLKIEFHPPINKRDLYLAGRSVYKDVYIKHVIVTEMFSKEALETCKQELAYIDSVEIAKFPVSGTDLQELGFTPGPLMGHILKKTEEWWVENDFIPDFKACLHHIQKLHLITLKDKI